mgnify:CR=1 FL=1
MKTKHLLIALAALTVASGAFAQSTTTRRSQNRRGIKTLNNQEIEAVMKASNATTPSNSTAGNNTADIKSYLESQDYRSLETKKALVECKSEALQDLPAVIVNSEGAFVVEKKKVNNSGNSTDFFGADPGVVFPGNLVYVNQSLADGNPNPCSFAPGKVRLTINKSVPGSESFADVINDYSHVHQQIINWLKLMGKTDESFSGQCETFYYSSASHMAADMNVSASYLQNKMKVSLSTSTSEMKIIAVENFSQDFYTVSASAINNDPTSLFGSTVTAANLKSGVNSNGPIGIISSVTYGRRAYRFREFQSKDFTFKGDESVKVSSGAVNVSAASTQEVTNSEKTSKFWAFVQSGNSSDKEIFNNNDAKDGNSDFMKAVTKNSSYSASNIGIPKNFTVRFLRSTAEATRKVTDVYYETNYVPCPKKISIEMKKRADQVSGSSINCRISYKVIHVSESKNKDGETVYNYELWNTPHNGKYASDTPSGYADFTRKNFSQGEERITRVIPTDDVTDYENCYVYGILYCKLEGNHASGQKWTQWDEHYLPVTAIPDDPSGAGKKAHIYINGSNYSKKNPYFHSDTTGKK